MKLKPLHVALGVAALGTGAYLLTRKSTPTPRKTTTCVNTKTSGGELDGVHYIEHVTGGANPDEPLPMLVVFHSLWATPQGSASFKSLPPTRVIRPYGPYTKDGKYSWFKTRSSGSDEDLTQSMRDTAKLVAPFLQDIVACRPTIGKPVVTGSSQGGLMSYLLASATPGLVRGAVAVAGRLPEPLWDRGMAQTVGIHGTRDTTVSYAKAKAFADAMGFPFYSFDAAHEVTSAMSKKWIAEVKQMMAYGVA